MDEIPANPTVPMDSLPSLDSSEDDLSTVNTSESFPAEGVLSSVSETAETFTSTETVVTTDGTSAMETETSGALTTTASLTDSNPSEPFISTDIVAADPTEVVQDAEITCEGIDDSQNDNEEDPSIAIDQFIKKIADEQLSGKRTVSEDVVTEDEVKDVVPANSETLESDLDTTESQIENTSNLENENPSQGEIQLIETNTENNETAMEVDQSQTEEPIKEVETPVVPEVSEPVVTEPAPQSDDSIKSTDSEIISNIKNDPGEVVTNVPTDVTTNVPTDVTATVVTTVETPVSTPAKSEVITVTTTRTPQVKLATLPKISQVRTVATRVVDSVKPNEIAKDPLFIAKAQEELKKIDVLVCGTCHDVFHFVEDFQKHKSTPCTLSISLVSQCENEGKPQVWGFILWKIKQVKNANNAKNAPSSWEIYQKWCKLPQADKNAWIAAGQTIQFCSKVGNAKVVENKPKPVIRPSLAGEKDPLMMDFAESNKENSQSMEESNGSAAELIKRGIIRPVKLNSDVTIHPSNKIDTNSNKAIRTTKILSTQKQEYAVEKIVAKRFNPRRKTWEYQIKWENFPSDSNTWEPVSNLNHCKQMLDQFEEQLRKLKEEKSKQTAIIAKGRGRPPKSPTSFRTIAPAPSGSTSSMNSNNTPGRPQRSSKQKAMDQVKAWCGTMSDNEGEGGGGGGVKRPFEDDDSDDSFEKKMKYEVDSDDSETEVKPKLTVKKPQPQPPTKPTPTTTTTQFISVQKNGTGPSAKQILPHNVLIPDANGVVRINQKQLPSLSTGVYIMSKTAGIIKLDSTTSKVATSGGQTIVKVAPKVGQTQIKIVKKDGSLTKQIIQVSPKQQTPTPIKPITAPKTYKPLAPKPKRAAAEIVKAQAKPKQEEPPPPPEPAEDSDDGIEPLEFPTDLPLPEPESPPGEFVLDPTTGKIAGKEYPDPPPPPQKIEPPEEQPPTTNELENIVKLAAADITEDDLQGDPLELEPKIDQSHHHVQQTQVVSKPVVTMVTTPKFVRAGPTRLTPKLVRSPAVVRTEASSILNKALTGRAGPTVVQKIISTPPPRPRVQQRIINTSVASRPSPIQQQVPLIRTVRPATQGGPIRTKIMAPKPKFNIAPQQPANRVQRFASMATSPPSKVQVYSTKSSPVQQQRRVGNTIIKSTNISPQKPQPQQRVVHTVYRASPKKEQTTYMIQTQKSPEKRVVQQRPKAVISMPSLLGDDDAPSKPKDSKPTTPIRAEKPMILASPQVEAPAQHVATAATPAAAAAEVTDLSSFTLADNENPIFITGDDGTVYQVAGQNEQGQTILITQGADGQQQCLLVTNEVAEEQQTETQAQESAEATEPPTIAVTEASAAETSPKDVAVDVKEPLQINTEPEIEGDGSDQVVAQVVRAEPPSPGGTHKVVVMLPDGNLMVTQVSPEEYASLELD